MPSNLQEPAMSIQTQQLVASVVSMLGIAASMLGWLSPEQVAGLTSNVLLAVGPLASIGGFAVSYRASRKAALVTAVAQLPEVKAVVTENTVDGVTLAHSEATPSNVVVNGAADAPHL